MKEASKKGKELGLKEYRLNMGIFEFDVVGVIGEYSKMGEYIAWKFDDKGFDPSQWDNGYEARGKVFYRHGYVPILWLPKLPKTKREHGTLAHESLHVVFHLFEWASLPISRDTEELAGHTVGHIVTNLFQ